MRDIIFQELRENNKYIYSISDPKRKEEGNEILINAVERIFELLDIGRKQGLLALEEVADKIDETKDGKYLQSMIMLVVDGTEPALLEDLCIARYFAANLSGFEALRYIVMLYGCLAIQMGENPRITEEKLISLIPEDAARLYLQGKEERERNEVQSDESNVDSLKEYCQGGIAASPGDEYYFQIRVTDYALKSIDDRSLQRLLRSVDNSELELAMKGLSGEARQRIFSNISKNLTAMIIEDMEFMGPVRMRDVAASIMSIFDILIKQISNGEILCTDAEALVLFKKIFDAAKDDAAEQKVRETETELYLLMKDYKSKSHKVINNPWSY